MFNDQIFNGVSTITPPTVPTGEGAISVGSNQVGWFDLLGHRITRLQYLGGKETKVQKEEFQNTGVHYNHQEGANHIIIEGTIKGANRGDVLLKVDEIKANLLDGEKYLKITEGTQIRRCRATCTDHRFSEDRTNINFQNFHFEFETFDYMEEVTPIDTLSTFSAPYSFNINRSGTAEAKLWLTLGFTSASSVTSLVVNIAGTPITINTAIASGDSVVIDGEMMRILKNGVKVGFIGTIPRLKSVNNTITITPNGSYSVNMIAQYRPAYK